ncbi:hypothetical protein HNV08_06815 [Winogradskyella eckloniae]|uniref:hypothetical protein n=1 Tax=Winogradskyella eckloniae TaxID=1089306 RepID=UPI001563F23A|nr:hypothetical protein [Winogradskyella eckloniae]NRD19755.1 hypothetical protein [Winogradskyella eckloniae]
MKKFIHKTNQYLLERYPTIWNTRLVWMLLSAFLLHLLFFVVGFLTLTNPEILHEHNVKDVFFKNGAVYFTTMVSILLLVGWLIYMFKNNGFKNFYPTSNLKLYGQFISYIIIIYSCSTFFLSYNFGVKSYIAFKYPDAQISKEIGIANDVAMFFSENVNDYTINRRNYPQLFFDLYCETTADFIDERLPFEEFAGEKYQFFNLSTKEISIDEYQVYNSYNTIEDTTLITPIYTKELDSTVVLYFKDSVVNIKPYLKTINPSYYNASSTFYIAKNDTLIDHHFKDYTYNSNVYIDYEYNSYDDRVFTLRDFYRNKKNAELLDRNDKAEITTLIDDFLKISDTYKIPHNLTAKKWTDLVYHPDTFEVKHFIRTEPKDPYFNSEFIYEQTKLEQFYSERVTPLFYQNAALKNTFENIEDIKASTPFADSIHFFMWFAFFFSCIIFMFRTTGLKPLLFSVITVGIIALIIALLGTVLSYVLTSIEDTISYTLLYFSLILSTIILAIPILYSDRIRKIIVGICVNISIIGFPLYLLLIIGTIATHQEDACRERKDYYQSGYQCDTIFDWFDVNWSFVFFFGALLFLFFFTNSIKKWKALSEG